MKIVSVGILIVVLSYEVKSTDFQSKTSSSYESGSLNTTTQLYNERVEIQDVVINKLRCRSGWLHWQDGNSCYTKASVFFFNSYATAEAGCFDKSAHLVTIQSAAENDFICNTPELRDINSIGFKTHTPFLGIRKSEGGEWHWITGEKVNYTNWSKVGPEEHTCAYIAYTCKWSTIDCSGMLLTTYICEDSVLENVPLDSITADLSSTEISTVHTTSRPFTTIVDDVTDTDIPVEKFNAKDYDITLYIVIPVAAVALCVSTGIICRVRKHNLSQANERNKSDILELSPILASMLPTEYQDRLRGLLLQRAALEIGEIQGRGAFGIVYKGRYSYAGDVQQVAIKALHVNCIGSDIRGLVDEAVIMADFNHMHVMSIIGVCIDPGEGLSMMVMPYMENADLNSYLRRFIFQKIDTQIPDEKQLLLFCLHIARGMEYLSGLKFIHRDLAARNCMVDTNLVVKVADFGLSRDVYTSSYYRQDEQKMLPVKWMPLESLRYGVFTSHSDMWSFGVTMWEVLSLGRIPYPELNNNVMLKNLETGVRLGKPMNCADEIYNVMCSCWNNTAEERPTFINVSEYLLSYLGRMCEYLELDVQGTAVQNGGNVADKGTHNIVTYNGDNSGIYHGENGSTGNVDTGYNADVDIGDINVHTMEGSVCTATRENGNID